MREVSPRERTDHSGQLRFLSRKPLTSGRLEVNLPEWQGNCYDSAKMESWSRRLKVQAIHGERLATRKQAKDLVLECIEDDYNRTRLRSTLGYLSPEQFELAHAA